MSLLLNIFLRRHFTGFVLARCFARRRVRIAAIVFIIMLLIILIILVLSDFIELTSFELFGSFWLYLVTFLWAKCLVLSQDTFIHSSAFFDTAFLIILTVINSFLHMFFLVLYLSNQWIVFTHGVRKASHELLCLRMT